METAFRQFRRTTSVSYIGLRKTNKHGYDAACNEIGAALMQLHSDALRPVAYVSRAFSESEQRCLHIKKETMGVVYGCERFRHFVYGRKVIVDTDHRPLIDISEKTIGEMSPRQQRFLLQLLRCGIEMQLGSHLAHHSCN